MFQSSTRPGIHWGRRCFRNSENAQKLPKPDLAFLIDLPEEVALARKNDIPSKEYLKERRHLYLDVAQNFNMEVLDGTERLDKIKSHVLKRVYEKILDDFKAR